MTVSRHGADEATLEGADDEMTAEDYLADKRDAQDRTGYPPVSDEELVQTAVDEKLPGGSQTY
jgi:hypothetical protein